MLCAVEEVCTISLVELTIPCARFEGISELAYAVGYNDPRYFSSIFKKEIGMQPSEYMERFTSGGTIEGE